MKSRLDCIPCLVNQAYNVGKLIKLPKESHEKLVRESIQYISKQPFDTKAPLISKKIWQFALKQSGNSDPMASIRHYYNQQMLKLEPELTKEIENSETPLFTSLKIAIAGNIIDFGAPHTFDFEKVKTKIHETLEAPLAKDHSNALFARLSESSNLMYLGDNCGEIVLDKLFIHQLTKHYPRLRVTFAVRGYPVLNDVIRKDAQDVGIQKYATIVDNGDSAPSTLIEKTSPGFKASMKDSDVIIAKGQGNFEGLSEYPKQELYYLFMSKCSYISELTGSPLYGLLCLKNKLAGTN